MNTQTSISTEQLIDLLEQRLPTTKADEVAALLRAGDPEVQALFGWLQQFNQLGREKPPARVRRQLRQEFDGYAQARKRPFLVAVFKAALSYDSYAQPALAGLRTGTPTAGRRLVYHAEVGDVTLNVQPQANGETCDLLGQIFTSEIETPPMSVQLLRDQSELRLTTADDLGEFRFYDLPAGSADLVLSSDYFEVTINALPLHAS